jgi:hypothetical protein
MSSSDRLEEVFPGKSDIAGQRLQQLQALWWRLINPVPLGPVGVRRGEHDNREAATRDAMKCHSHGGAQDRPGHYARRDWIDLDWLTIQLSGNVGRLRLIPAHPRAGRFA